MQPKQAILNDLNKELINVWKIIQKFPYQLIEAIEKLKTIYHQETDYYLLRDNYNQLLVETNLSKEQKIKQAALFIFLNKNCFNGLYRVNSQGQFNAPWNKTINHQIYEQKNLLAISSLLNTIKVQFYNQDFKFILKMVKSQDLIYLDPPYDLVKKTTFTSYTETGFNLNNQEKLARLFQKLDNKGCYVMLSNHKTHNIWNLYQKKGFFLYDIPVNRLISSKKANRKTVTEVLITNFSLPGQEPLLISALPYENLKTMILHKNHYMAKNPKWYADLLAIKKKKIFAHQQEITALKKLHSSFDLKKDLVVLIKSNQKILELLTLIFATRWEKFQKKITKIDPNFLNQPEAFVDFLDKGKFLTVFSPENISTLDNYLWGVEVGMDSHTRKNRSGQIMQDWVQTILENKNGIKIWEQKKIDDIPAALFSFDCQNLDPKLLNKVWDFILKTDDKFYFLECNYFDVAGSKIDTVAAQYSYFYTKINQEHQLSSRSEFIWITDGIFWQTGKNLQKYQKYVPNLLFLKDLLLKQF